MKSRDTHIMTIVLAMFVIPASVLAEEVVLYDVNFNSDTVGETPAIACGFPPRDNPTSIWFGWPTVVSELGPLEYQPCRFGSRGPSPDDPYEQIVFYVEQTAYWGGYTIPCSWDDYHVELQLVVQPSTVQNPDFAILLDLPQVQRIDFEAGGIISAFPTDGPIGTFTPGELMSIEINITISTKRLQIKKNGLELFAGPMEEELEVSGLESVRLSLKVDGSDDVAAVDNILITASGTPGSDVTITGPSNQMICEQDPVTFQVTASGGPALGYQWRHDGQIIPGATEASYTIDSVSTWDGGSLYDVVVTNCYDWTFSNAATLSVLGHPIITQWSSDRTVAAGSRVVFDVTALGAEPLSYTWFYLVDPEATPVELGQGQTYTIDSASAEDTGWYDVVVTDAYGCSTHLEQPVLLAVASMRSEDNFDDYETGSDLDGLGGWEGWEGEYSGDAEVTDEFAYSLPHSAAIYGAADIVHPFSGQTSGQRTFAIWTYVPSSSAGDSYFILLNTYEIGAHNWSTQVRFNRDLEVVASDFDGAQLPLIFDEWVELRVEIDLDVDWQEIYYGGELLVDKSWTDGVSGGGALNIAAVDLFAGGSSPVYYDDMWLDAPLGACCFPSGSCHDVIAEGDCVSVGGEWQGQGSTCETAGCPQPSGACCLPDGSCMDVSAEECDFQGGVYQGDGTACGSADCPQPLGACCLEYSVCYELTESECTGAGGIWYAGETCEAVACPHDCNDNGIPDSEDIAACDGSAWCSDCDENGVPDQCDIADGWSLDCNDNGFPDECDIADGTSQDCQRNGVPDECDIADGTSEDANDNGIPDECDCPGDLDGDWDIDLADLAQLLSNYGTISGAGYGDGDLDADGDVDLADLAALLAVYGTTCP